ncbi:Sad1 / UNC-like protein [Dictyocaulus viviparus]|uniref:Sad1 / UNC-like protein n=1 Tax=Dictyocaulus viviparus TaxID=29172 RepID=A0A0D8X7H8_DICVI|nr:Sad1 / UNC-like protein [Dictyocaulus viviparus]
MRLSNIGSAVFTKLVDSFSVVWSGIFALVASIGNSLHRPLFSFESVIIILIIKQRTEVKLRPSTEEKSDSVCVPSFTSPIDEARLVDKITAAVLIREGVKIVVCYVRREVLEARIGCMFLKSRLDIDYSLLESSIRTAIHEYDSDKTGMFDFALESAGASIISTRCSENYNTYSRLEKIWNIPLWYSSYGPRTVIQRNSKTLFPGECWSFKGSVGYITIRLSHAINVTLISYEHIGVHQAPGGQRPSAPKTFKIWAHESENDMNTRVLGDFMYDLKGNPLQFFVVNVHGNVEIRAQIYLCLHTNFFHLFKAQPEYPRKKIEMEVTSYYRAPYTSLGINNY